MKRPAWCDRAVMMAPYYCLCLSEEAFHHAVRRMKVPLERVGPWVNDGASATTTTFVSPAGTQCCLVSLRNTEGRDPIEIAGILVHEAVHVWQAMCRHLGEHDPSSELEAYSIQRISQRLMQAYADSLNQN